MISIAIIENIAEIRDSLVEYFNSQANLLCETMVNSVDEFFKKSSLVFKYNVILLDISLPDKDLIKSIKLIKEKWVDADILLFTIYDDQDKIFRALCAGAAGYILKSTPFPKIVEAFEDCFAGCASMSPQIARKVLEYLYSSKQPYRRSILSEKEKQVLAGLVNGLNYKMIATFLKSTEEAVRHNIKNIYKKLYENSDIEVI